MQRAQCTLTLLVLAISWPVLIMAQPAVNVCPFLQLQACSAPRARAVELEAALAWDSSLTLAFTARVVRGKDQVSATITVPEEGGYAKAQALATLITPFGTKSFGRQGKITTTVFWGDMKMTPADRPTAVGELIPSFLDALNGNSLFLDVRSGPATGGFSDIWLLIFRPKVIQYRIGGNEFQYENNQLTNVVAASHMAKVLSLTSLNKQLAGQSIRWAATTEQCNTIADGGC